MTNKICLITPPDTVHTKDYSILLVYPSTAVKEEFNDITKNLNKSLNVYLYEPAPDEHDPEWFYNTVSKVDNILVDFDNCPSLIRDIFGYLLSFSKTYWLTKGEHLYYNKLNMNKIYNLDYLKQTIGGTVEIQSK
jgi:hypothetical protein